MDKVRGLALNLGGQSLGNLPVDKQPGVVYSWLLLCGLPCGFECAIGMFKGSRNGEVRRRLECLDLQVTGHDKRKGRGLHAANRHQTLIAFFTRRDGKGAGEVEPKKPVKAGARKGTLIPAFELLFAVVLHARKRGLHRLGVGIIDQHAAHRHAVAQE